MVDHNHDRVETPRRREIGNEVNRQEHEGDCRGGRDGDERQCHRVYIGFHLLAKGATVNIFMDIGTKAWPPEVMFDEFFHFKTAGVAHHGMVMELAKEVMLCRGRYIGAVLVI
jgi:hypothetical protein